MEEVLEATFGDLFRQWMATKPNESNDREWIYSTALALSKLTDRFTQEIAVVEEEEARERLEKERGDGETVPA